MFFVLARDRYSEYLTIHFGIPLISLGKDKSWVFSEKRYKLYIRGGAEYLHAIK
jgi:hypothetical protein